MKKLLTAFAACLLMAACGGGGGGDAGVADAGLMPEKQVGAQKVAIQVNAVAAVQMHNMYADLKAVQNMDLGWGDLIRIPDVVQDRTMDNVSLATLLTGGPDVPSLALQLTIDPSPVIMVCMGHIDALFGDVSLPTHKDNLREAVRVVQAAGKTAELCGLMGVGSAFSQKVQVRRDQFDKAARSVAQEMGVKFYDIGSVPFHGS